jgi:hypothetical protein
MMVRVADPASPFKGRLAKVTEINTKSMVATVEFEVEPGKAVPAATTARVKMAQLKLLPPKTAGALQREEEEKEVRLRISLLHVCAVDLTGAATICFRKPKCGQSSRKRSTHAPWQRRANCGCS